MQCYVQSLMNPDSKFATLAGYTGIRSTVVCPYFINTGMFHGANGGAFSFLSPEYVASEVVKGVLLNKDVIILPPHLLPLIALKQ